MNKQILHLVIFSFLTLFLSCQKKIEPNTSELIQTSHRSAIASSPVPALDWENISFMPQPEGAPRVPVPWQSGFGGAKIDPDVLTDYRSSDGWVLVFNTFSADFTASPKYFMLYNKFRGLLKVYFYITPDSNYPSNNIVHLLRTVGSSSPMLNFAATDMVDYQINHNSIHELQQYTVSASGAWYGAEFEIAYDPTTAFTPYMQKRLSWHIYPNSIADMVFNGTQQGTIDGSITTTSSSSNFGGDAVGGFVDGSLKLGADSAANRNFLKIIPEIVRVGLIGAAKSALGGVVTGFLSGIIGGSSQSQSEQKVDLKINTDIQLSGTATVSSELFDNIFSVPGSLGVDNTEPYFPAYSEPMGVFYITGRPKVNLTITERVIPGNPREGIQRTFVIGHNFAIQDPSSNIVFNPSLIAVADVENITQSVLTYYNVPPSVLTGVAAHENIGGTTVFVGSYGEIYSPSPRSYRPDKVAVRVSFDVVPKNGAPRSTIVKTFLADLVN